MIPFFSTDDDVAAVIAVGGKPTGIIAIGGMPTGVVAIGACSVGLVAVSVGVAAGGVAISCGVMFGVYTLGVGGGASVLPASVIGGGIAVLDDDGSTSVERVEELDCDPDAPGLPPLTTLLALTTSETKEGWVAVDCEGGASPILRHQGAPLEATFTDEATATARGLRGPARALLVAEQRPDDRSAGYRATSARTTFTCKKIVAVPRRTRTRRRTRWSAWRMLKALLFTVVAVGVGLYARERWLDATLPRVVDAAWPATVHASTSLSNVSDCSLMARLRSDGRSRLIARPTIRCRGFTLEPDNLRCAVHENAMSDGTFTHALRCARDEVYPDDDSEGVPAVDIDTTGRHLIVRRTKGKAYRVQLEIAEWSTTRSPTRLFDAP